LEPLKELLELVLKPALLFLKVKPKIPGLYSFLGISCLSNLLEQVTPEGVYIYAENVFITNSFVKIVKNYNI
jgi:hypothetical protein